MTSEIAQFMAQDPIFEQHKVDPQQIRRKPVLSGLINEYMHAA
jgi:hypothetical protein